MQHIGVSQDHFLLVNKVYQPGSRGNQLEIEREAITNIYTWRRSVKTVPPHFQGVFKLLEEISVFKGNLENRLWWGANVKARIALHNSKWACSECCSRPGLPAGRHSAGRSSVTAAGSWARAAGGVASLTAAAAAALHLAMVRASGKQKRKKKLQETMTNSMVKKKYMYINTKPPPYHLVQNIRLHGCTWVFINEDLVCSDSFVCACTEWD